MEKVIYTTSSCDEHSFVQLKVFLASLAKHNDESEYPVILDLVNDTIEAESALRKIYSNIMELNHVSIPITDEIVYRRTEAIPAYNIKVMYSRPLGLKRVLADKHDMVLSIDTDIIIRGSLDKIWKDVVPGSIKVWDKGPTKKDRVRFQGGVIVYGNSKETRRYYDEVLDIIGDIRDFSTGQAALYHAYLKHKGHIKKLDMPTTFNDSNFEPESVIWHCKHSHFHTPEYQWLFESDLRQLEEDCK